MLKDPFTAIQESLEDARPQFTALIFGAFNAQQKRALLKLLGIIQEAVHNYVKSKKNKKKKDGDGDSRGAEQVKIDWLDTEGVHLWNLASQVNRATPTTPELSKDELSTVAALRLTGFRLVEAATDIKGPATFVVRLLGLTAKTMTALLEAGNTPIASQLALQGAEYEQLITSSFTIKEPSEFKQKVTVLVWYYMARIDFLLREGNDSFAYDLLYKAIQLDETWPMAAQEFRLLASKCWTVGNDLLNKRINISGSIDWLKQGLLLVEKLINRGVQLDHLKELHIAILKSLSRAQLVKAEKDPHALTSATAALNELGEVVGDSDQATLHEMRLLQLHILKTRKASEGELRIVMEDIMKLTDWTEDSVLEILSQLASLIGQYPALPSQSVQTYLRLALASSSGHPYVRIIMYEGLLFVKALSPPISGVSVAAEILDMISKDLDYQLDDKVSAIACQTLLWNIGMFNESKERITEAAHWYQLAAHAVFKELGGENISRCLRKAALCHTKMADWTAALDLISFCPKEEASTHYLTFLAAIRQGREEAAIDAVSSIVECTDFEAQQLVLMTSLANEKGSKHVLMASMRALLNALTDSAVSFDVQIETITVIRCLIRMTVMELAQVEDKDRLVESMIEYLQTAIDILTEDPTKGQGQMKEIAWLYKCAYNVAVQGLNTLSSKSLADLFDTSAQLMSIYDVIVISGESDPDLHFVRGSAMFACLCGKIFVCRDLSNGSDKILLLDQLLDYIPHCREALSSIKSTHPRWPVVTHMRRIIDTSEVELRCESNEWTAIPPILQRMKVAHASGETCETNQTLEMMANVLFQYEECPSHITYQLLELILDTCPTAYANDIKRYSRWMRAILRILLHRNGAEEEAESLKHAGKALDVLKTSNGKGWLVATSWNKGLEWFSSSRVSQAKAWCEIAMTIATSTPELNIDRQKMNEHYEHLLSKIDS
ncbi:hypothetical protein J008_04781 [Cryptococcus neoformans]|nr:hypothetical protein J008_04781 [Cryptococcus neoformans var. grubii]